MVIESPPRVSPAARWLAGLAVAALPLVIIVLTYLWWQDRLPDPMASHWGAHGRVDGTTARADLVGILAAIAAVGALLGAIGVGATRVSVRGRCWLVTAGAAIGGLGVGTWLMLATLALDAADAAAAGTPTWQVTALPVAMSVLAGLAYAACPPPPPHPAATGRPAPGLPRLDLPRGHQAVYSEVNHALPAVYAAAAVALAVAAGLGVWATPWAGLPLAMVGAIVLLMSITRLTVDVRGLRAGFGPLGWPRVTVPLREIAAAEVTEVRPSQWGGWGFRIRPGGSRGLILRRGPGVRLLLSGEREFVATTRDPATVAGLVNTLLDRAAR